MPNANTRHVCPACEGHDSAQCDVCDGTGARLCDACDPTVAQRAVVSEAGTAVCRPCLLRGLADMEREFADLRATWLRLHRSPSAGRAETLAAYEATKRAEAHLLDTRAAVRLVLATAANDVVAPPPPVVTMTRMVARCPGREDVVTERYVVAERVPFGAPTPAGVPADAERMVSGLDYTYYERPEPHDTETFVMPEIAAALAAE